ncbi:hypothetical protein [uncultured Intestinimonas sp.]|uniref:hypothetical protein n=1 Tax=uncultured Intestinimonas sp. TaxID=1689265 RepID=UPI0025E631C8|nr:hypothetical protein [uncultured Intestinimonas sp.]
MSWPWDELGLDGPASLKEVRQAYAKRLKETHPEEDSEGFQRLHEAYQAARQAARGHSPGRPRGELEEDASRDTTLDFSSLEEEAPKPAPQEAKGETFDFDALLEQEEVPLGQARGGAAEDGRDAARILLQQQARQKDARQEDPFRRQEGESPTEAAVRIVHALLREGQSSALWEAFFTSPLFFQVKWEPAFLSGLMAAFSSYAVWEPAVRTVVLRAYGLEKGRPPEKLRMFYETISGQKAKKPSLWARIFPRKTSRKQKLVGVVCILLLAAVFLAVNIPNWDARRQRQTMVEWLTADIGQPVASYFLEGGVESYEDEYYLVNQPEVQFIAVPEGERDLSRGEVGYTTNFGGELLNRELEKLKDRLDVYMMDDYDPQEELWAFTLRTDLTEYGEAVAAVAEKIQALAAQPWWELYPPYFTLSLAYGEVIYYTYRSGDGPFSAQEMTDAYDAAPATLYGRVIEESGMAALDFGDTPHTYLWKGEVEVDDWPYDLMVGVNTDTGEVMRLYFKDSIALRSIAPEDMPTGQDWGYDYIEFRHYLDEFETDAEIVEQMGILHLVRK